MESKNNYILPENLHLDRKTNYKGTEYKIVEVLTSGMLLVVNKNEFDAGKFPLQTYVVPGE